MKKITRRTVIRWMGATMGGGMVASVSAAAGHYNSIEGTR